MLEYWSTVCRLSNHALQWRAIAIVTWEWPAGCRGPAVGADLEAGPRRRQGQPAEGRTPGAVSETGHCSRCLSRQSEYKQRGQSVVNCLFSHSMAVCLQLWSTAVVLGHCKLPSEWPCAALGQLPSSQRILWQGRATSCTPSAAVAAAARHNHGPHQFVFMFMHHLNVRHVISAGGIV